VSFEKVYALIGFAYKASKCVAGSCAVFNACKRKKAKLIITDGCSENTVKKVSRYSVGILALDGNRLGDALGNDVRIAAITDRAFKEAIMRAYMAQTE
jgi:ribosomal protein L7Ae-like RNA K-turn-binding protein